MKIVFVIANNSTVPLWSLFMREAAARKDAEFEFVAMTPVPPKMAEEASAYGFPCHWVPFDCSHRKSQMLLAVPRLYALFRRLRPDVVHTQLFDDSVPALLAARLAGVPTRVITKQDTGFHRYFRPQWQFMDRFNNANATHVLAVSEEVGEFLRSEERCSPAKIHMIHHGIAVKEYSAPDPAEVRALRNRFGMEGRTVVGTVARFIEWKGYLDIIRVVEIVAKQAPEALFVWAGYGDQVESLRRILRERRLEGNVTILGYLEPRLMPQLFGAMDIYLHAAFMEPFGYVIAEAMMAGLPVVSTPTGAARDAIRHGENGWLGSYHDPDSLAAGVMHYIRSRPAKPFLAAQETAAAKFDFTMTYDRYLKLYASAAKKG